MSEVRQQCRKELREALRRVTLSNENVLSQQAAAIKAEGAAERMHRQHRTA